MSTPRFVRLASALVIAVSVAGEAAAQQQISSKVPLAFNRFYDTAELYDAMARIAAAYPGLVSITEIGKSAEGRPMLLATLNNPATGRDIDKPAMWIDGNIHGNEIQAAETVLYSLWYLASAYGSVGEVTELVDRCSFYFLPTVNPDGRASWFRDTHSSHSSRTGRAPVDDDKDGVADEDAPEDLDGDGSIGMMWRKDPNGSHRRSVDDPRVFERVDPEPLPDGSVKRGDWSMAGSEGIDNDGDGRTNEDSPGTYDMNRNWPSDWQPEHLQGGAGPWPLCWPETRCIADFILAHPNIAAVQSYHNAGGMILRGPGHPSRDGEYSAGDRNVYERIQKAGEEMLPFYKAMVIHSDLYPVRGGFVNWTAEGLGIVSLTNELWSDKRILQSGSDPDEAARMRWTDRMLLGQTFSDWKEVQHPEFGTVLVGGGDKWSSRIPPPFMLEEECHRNFAFTMFHAAQMPVVRIAQTQVKPLPGGLWQVDVELANDRLIPTRTQRAAQRRIGLADSLTCTGEGIEVVASGRIDDFMDRTIDPVRYQPWRLWLEGGVPSLSPAAFRFIVKAPEGATAKFDFTAEKARDLHTEVLLKK